MNKECKECGEVGDLIESICYPCTVDGNIDELMSISEWMVEYE